MKTTKRAASLILIGLSLITVGATKLSAQTSFKTEMGLTKMKAEYPSPDSKIDNRAPSITADASGLEFPLATQSVIISLNGNDVTADAEITPSYVMYKPAAPLAPGKYEVRITARDINKKDLDPLAWNFTITGQARPVSKELRQDNTTGRYSVSADYISARYAPQTFTDVSALFREKEGMKINADLSFTNISYGRTISGAFHRETQQYTDIELDKSRLDYSDANFTASLGNFWLKTSELTVIGTELAGAKIDKTDGKWAISFFSGRSQDPSTSGTFKQETIGAIPSYAWNAKNKTSIIALTAREQPDAYRGLFSVHTSDDILSITHEYNKSEKIKAAVEMAVNHRIARGCPGGCASNAASKDSSNRDSAFRASAAWANQTFEASAEIYRIGANFMPVSEGNSKLLRNDRNGARVTASWQIIKLLSAGAEVEQYETDSSRLTTKRATARVTVGDPSKTSATYSKGKLAGAGTVSETDNITATINIPPFAGFTRTYASAGWQKSDYTSSASISNTKTRQFSLASNRGNRLNISLGYSLGDTDSATLNNVGAVTSLTSSRGKNYYAGFTVKLIPRRLSWIQRYEFNGNTGTSLNMDEKKIVTGVEYYSGKDNVFTAQYEIIKYNDRISPAYNHRQNIVRAGVLRRF